jgi:hypothetical protein
MKQGGYWRTAIFSGRDTARYRLESGKQPNALDQIIDSACDLSTPHREIGGVVLGRFHIYEYGVYQALGPKSLVPMAEFDILLCEGK